MLARVYLLYETVFQFVSILYVELYVISCLSSSWNNLSVRVYRHLGTIGQFISTFFLVTNAKYVYRKFVFYPGFVMKYLVPFLHWH